MTSGLAREDHIGDRQFVMALARGLDILRAFDPKDSALGNQELARRTKLPKPTISRLTYTLTKLGYLNYDRRHGVYSLGGAVLGLGYVALLNLNVRRIARPWMQELAIACGAPIGLGARYEAKIIYVEQCQANGSFSLRPTARLGTSLTASAMGRAYIAGLPESQRIHEIDRLTRACPERQDAIRQGVEQAVAEIAMRGFCLIAQESGFDINAVGAPIALPEQGDVYALSCGGPSDVVAINDLETVIGPKLVEIAHKTVAAMIAPEGKNVSKNLRKM